MNEHNNGDDDDSTQKTKGRVDQISIPFCVVVRFVSAYNASSQGGPHIIISLAFLTN
jgi:hypothetical protein